MYAMNLNKKKDDGEDDDDAVETEHSIIFFFLYNILFVFFRLHLLPYFFSSIIRSME